MCRRWPSAGKANSPKAPSARMAAMAKVESSSPPPIPPLARETGGGPASEGAAAAQQSLAELAGIPDGEQQRDAGKEPQEAPGQRHRRGALDRNRLAHLTTPPSDGSTSPRRPRPAPRSPPTNPASISSARLSPCSSGALAFRDLHLERLLFAEIDEVFRCRVFQRLQVREQRRNTLRRSARQELRGR